MRCLAVYVTVLLALILPQLCFAAAPAETLGPDLYFPSTTAAQQVMAYLPTPPAPGTAAQAVNVQLLNTIMSSAGPAAVAQAQFDATLSVFDFAQVLGPGFSAQNLPVTNAFFSNVAINTQNTNINLDLFYRSQGPVTPNSYPSAHTLFGYVDGVLLGDMVPEKKDELQRYGVQYGVNRLILGQHWPADVYAAQMEASILLGDLFGSPQFQADFNRAKIELRTQLGLN